MRITIREKILVISTVTLLLAIGANTFVMSQMLRKGYSSALQSKMDVIANTLKSNIERLLGLGIAVDNIEGFESQCQEILLKHKEVAYVTVVRANGEILFHNDPAYHGTKINDPHIREALTQNKQILCLYEVAGQKFYNTVVPVVSSSNEPIAAVIIGFPTILIDNKIHELLRYSFMAAIISLGLAIILLLTSLSISVTKPLYSLVTTIHQIRESSDLSKRVKVVSKDELGDLARSFNQMTEDLQRTTTSIDSLNLEIERRKKVELSLRRSDYKYRTLLKNIPQKIFYKDLNSVYVLCNESYAADLGIRPDDIKGKTDYDLHPKQLAEKYITDDRRIIESGKGEILEERYTHDGKELFVYTSKSPVRDEDGNVVGIFGIFWDITDKKLAELRQTQLLTQLEKANKELNEFVYIMSHDLKTPLRGINTLVDWVSTDYADKFDQEGKEKINLLLSRVKRMYSLLDGILQYTEVGRLKEEKKLVNLNTLVPDIINMIEHPENITITIEDELPVIECEEKRITHIFRNLVNNAVKYMDKPQGHIKIGCVEENNFWNFSVSDNGPGIEERYFEKIFQLFQTLAPRDEIESAGVGLTVVKKTVEMYGGRIWVESKVGQGSTFFFTLPNQEVSVKNEQVEVGVNC